ncbi:MAG TPA: DUF4153 domain-containing protein, partial [Actinomycetota bacterium]
MPVDPPPIRTVAILGWALAFAFAVDLLADGPPGLGAAAAAGVAALGLVVVGRPRPVALAFLAAGVSLMGWTVVRASPVLALLDVVAAMGLFALGAAFAREGDPARTALHGYAARATAWVTTVPRGIAWLVAPFARLVPGRGRSMAIPRAVAIALPVGLLFVLLLSSADAVFAEIVRTPLA